MNYGPDDPHAEALEFDVLPFKRQNLLSPEAGALGYHHPCGSAQEAMQGSGKLLNRQDDRLLPRTHRRLARSAGRQSSQNVVVVAIAQQARPHRVGAVVQRQQLWTGSRCASLTSAEKNAFGLEA